MSTSHDPNAGYIWDFDVVYLDYFGKLLPYDRGTPRVQSRARALRQLFSSDREDAWQLWLLMITVESRFGAKDRQHMRDYLSAARRDSQGQSIGTLDYFLQTGLNRRVEAARLVHATLAYIISIAASNADVEVRPRPTVLYHGWKGTPMLHFAYHILPTATLSQQQDPLTLLQAPLVQPTNPPQWPWFQLLADQPPGQTEAQVRAAFGFLPQPQVNRIVLPSP